MVLLELPGGRAPENLEVAEAIIGFDRKIRVLEKRVPQVDGRILAPTCTTLRKVKAFECRTFNAFCFFEILF
jgi:hypothetical protein